MSGVVRLEWQKDSLGYEIVPVEQKPTLIDDDDDDLPRPSIDCIKRKGGALEVLVLEGVARKVFLKLANTPPTSEGVLAFVDEFGLPLDRGLWDRPPVSAVYKAIADLCALLDLAEKKAWSALERALEGKSPRLAGLAPSKVQFKRLPGDTAPRVFIQPQSLIGFCQWELMQHVHEDSELRRCQNCGAFLFVRVKGRRGPQQQHCSTTCRVAMHRKGQGSPRARRAAGTGRP